ncbi:MAG: cytochrome c3 family protein [Deltaproteobacteria bacterium]
MKRSIIVVVVWLLVAGCMGTEGTKRKEYVWPESKNKAVRIHPPREEPVTMEPFRPESDLLQRTEELIGATEFHYTGKYCDQCHEKTPVKGGNIYLKYDGDYNLLCKCHLKTPNSYIHPTNIVPSDKKKTKIPADLPLEKGKVTCLTCHDIYRQCQERSVEKYSLRGMPYRKTTDFCFKCHDESDYQMLNPHKQLDEHGNIIVDKCLYCHTEVLDVKKEHHEDPKLIGNLGPLCQRCHIRLAMRGGGFNHLAKPTPEIMAKIKQTEERFGAVLPLDEDGKTTCATCHNPHEKGVIPEGMPAARGAGSLHRLRLPPPMCQWCHQVPTTFEK